MKLNLVVPIAVAVGLSAAPATAAPYFTASGSFKPSTGASSTTLLGGGSFDAVFAFATGKFPTADGTAFSSYTVNIRNAAGAILLTLSSSIAGNGGYVGTSYASTYGGTRIYFYDSKSDYLQIVVPAGFTGSGAILANGYSYAQIAPLNQATVGSGTVSAVPEPASWAMMIGGLGLVGYAMRRRRTVVASA